MIDRTVDESLTKTAPDVSLFEESTEQEPEVSTTSSDPTLNVQAAYMTGEGDVASAYESIKALPMEERSAAVSAMSRTANELEVREAAGAVGSILSDPRLTEQDKAAYAEAFVGIEATTTNSMEVMAEKMYVKSSGLESPREEFQLLDAAGTLRPMMEELRLSQQDFNLLSIGKDGEAVSIFNNPGDMADAVLPGSEQLMAAGVREKMTKGEISTVSQLAFAMLHGEGQKATTEFFQTLPYEKRMSLLKEFPKLLNDTTTLAITNDNDLLQLNSFLVATKNEYYGDLDRTLDNLVGIADMYFGAGFLFKPITKAASMIKIEKIRETMKSGVRSTVQPASTSKVAQATSATESKTIAAIIEADTTGEAAKVLAGTTRTEAVVDATAPQLKGSVEAKPYGLSEKYEEAASDAGKPFLSEVEIGDTRDALKTDMSIVNNVVARGDLNIAPLTVENAAGGTGRYEVSATYGPPGGGFVNPEKAITETLENLAERGVKEGDLTLLQRKGTKYVETTVKEVKAKKAIREQLLKGKKKLPEGFRKTDMQDDYVVRAAFEYDPKATDIVREDMPVKRNWFDKHSMLAKNIPGRASVSRWIFAAQYMLDKTITKGASAAVDQGNALQKLMVDEAKRLVLDPMSKLSPDRMAALDEVIIQQNLNRTVLSPTQLSQIGITKQAEIDILDNWKYINDQNWHLTNRDMAKTLRDTRHSLYRDLDSGDDLVVKAMSQKEIDKVAKAYNPVTKTEDRLTDEALKALEESGGSVVELRHPQVFGTTEVSHMIVKGGDTNRFVRAIQLDDVLLPYVPGHFQIRYKDAWFIERFTKGADGKALGKGEALLTSPNLKSAAKAVGKFEEADDSGKYIYRYRNDKGLSPQAITDKQFDISTNAGMSSQRRRGETLKQFTNESTELQMPNIESPIDSFIQSTRELAKRVPLRAYIDDLQARMLDQYEEVFPRDAFGRPRLPTSTERIGEGIAPTGPLGKMAADARTSLEYYNYMKYGYHNTLDGLWRGTFNMLSEQAGRVSSRMEGLFRAIPEEVPSPIGFLRGMAFNAHIAASIPSSQWFVQGMPAFQNVLLHPSYATKGGLAKDWGKLSMAITWQGKPKAMAKVFGKERAAEMIKLRKEWDKSGLGAGIDKHLLVEGGLDQFIESTRFKTIKNVKDTTTGALRKAGFDLGEFVHLSTHWLGVRNDAIQSGKSMDNARDFNDVRAKARSLTLNMNKSGEMPWNKNELSLLTQFLISPYKGMTAVLDRGLTRGEKRDVFLWQSIMMPMQTSWSYRIAANFDLTDVQKEVVVNGVLGGMFNTMTKAMSEDNSSISFQRWNLQDFGMPVEFIAGLFETGGGTNFAAHIASHSPSLSMLSGHNPIAANLVEATGKLFTAPIDLINGDDEKALLTMKTFADSVLKYSAFGRAVSTGYKEMLASQYSERYARYNNSGAKVDPSIALPATFAKVILGLETTSQTLSRFGGTKMFEEKSDLFKDADNWIKEMNRLATIDGFNMDDPGREEYMMRAMLLAYPDGVAATKIQSYIAGKILKQIEKGNSPLVTQIGKAAGYGMESDGDNLRVLDGINPDAKALLDYYNDEQSLAELIEATK